MRNEINAPRKSILSHPLFHFALRAKLSSFLSYLFLAITVFAIFIPLNPRMPSKGLDASWELAMNETVARHMTFGRQIVFTYGPYASIGTRTYHPATDRRMMWGSFFVAVSYVAGLLYVTRGRRRYLMFLLLLFLATFGNPELLLLSFSFLLVICALKHLNSDVSGEPSTLSWWELLAALVMWSTLGLLPLVKGSLLLPFAAAVAIPSALFLYHRHIKHAIVLLLVPIVSAIALWVYAGQPLGNLTAFLRGTFLLTSGYTEAMSTAWLIFPAIIGDGLVVAFLALSVLLCLSVCHSVKITVASRVSLAVLCGVSLLVIFKHGFVKADSVSGAFCSLAVLILIVGLLHVDRYLIWSLVIAMTITTVTSVMQDSVLWNEVHDRFGSGITWGEDKRKDIFIYCVERAIGAYPRTTYKSTWKTYADAWSGLRARVSPGDELAARFAKAMEDIRRDYTFPVLTGGTDVYEYEDSFLLASDDQWDPRPIFQSYSAYTPVLADINEEHLRGQEAPEWVLFDLQSVGGRLPSLDDGISWPALLDNYTLVTYDGRFAQMRRKPVTHAYSDYLNVTRETCKTGDTITLPATDGPLFAEVDMKPTLAGRLLIALFNPPQLHIVLGLANGKTSRYRVVSNMMTTGFVVSPLVNDTKSFALLAAGSKDVLDEDRVDTISISPSYGGSLFWSGTYTLTLKKYVKFDK